MCDSVVPVKRVESFSRVVAKSPIGRSVQKVLQHAFEEKRITIGLLPSIKYLTQNCNGALFCFTSEATPGDSATHMQEVLLQAFCVENEIYVIKVDSTSKLKRIFNALSSEMDFSCVLVHYPYTDPFSDNQEVDLSLLTKLERDLLDHCEENWGCAQVPVIRLPEK